MCSMCALYLFSCTSIDLLRAYVGQSVYSAHRDVRPPTSDVVPSPLKTPLKSVIAHANHSRHSPRQRDGQGGSE